MPVRKIKATAVSVTGDLWRDDGEFDDFESYLERCRLLLLRYEDPPCSWECQPMKIVARGPDGVLYKCFPDTRIVRWSRAGTSLITIEEVKYAESLKKHRAEWKSKWIAIREYCRERGWRFEIFTDVRRNRAKDLLRNIRLIRWYGRDAAYSRCPEAIINLLRGRSTLKAGLIIQSLQHRYTAGEISGTIFYLLWHRALIANLRVPLSDQTDLWIRE